MALNKQTAVHLAKVCLWAYDFDESREAELLTFKNKKLVRDLQIGDDGKIEKSFAGVVEYDDVVIVAFQGTITEFGVDGVFRLDSLVDWIDNFKVKQWPRSKTGLPGKVHEGFFSQLDLIYDDVCNALKTMSGKPIIVTGHSQGGAIASLATKRLKSDGFEVSETYTFAAPRCGDAVFAKSINTPFHRIEYGHDVVPHVPPILQTKILGTLSSFLKEFSLPHAVSALTKLASKVGKLKYAGVGKLTYRSEDGPLQTDISATKERALFKRRKRELIVAGKRLVRHHGLEHYIKMFE